MWGFDGLHKHPLHEMAKIDAALTVGLLASLRGYAKPELTARGEWNSSLARLAMKRDLIVDGASDTRFREGQPQNAAGQPVGERPSGV